MAAQEAIGVDEDFDPGKILGRVIRRHRQRNKMVLKELSLATGIPLSNLSRIENGGTRIDFATLRAIARALKMPTELLVSEAEAVIRGDTPQSRETYDILQTLMVRMGILRSS